VVSCWGTNQLGELGDGSAADFRSTPAPISSSAPGVELAASGHHTCVRLEDGSAWCWGANQSGQLGEGTTSTAGVPVPVIGLADVEALAVGLSFSCARRRDGSLWCWGDDRLGQLGLGSSLVRDVPSPVLAAGPAGGGLAITAGRAHTCVRQAPAGSTPDAPAAIACWGANQAGQLGDGSRVDRGTAAPLKIVLAATEVVSGALHACARTAEGAAWCWGRGSAGQLGTTMSIDYAVPVRATSTVALASALATLGAGGAHTCGTAAAAAPAASAAIAAALCWGANDEGQLGDGTRDRRAGAVAVTGLAEGVRQWALGLAHTCALFASGRVACWGRGEDGQLGDGRASGSATPVEVVGVRDAVAIAAGDGHTCAVLRGGALMCWGQGAAGQLGWGSTQSRSTPTLVMGVSEAVEVVAGSLHTCVRSAPRAEATLPGPIACWGDNRLGQLGDGTRNALLKPAGQPVVAEALALAAGAFHTCALRPDRSFVCWGSDATGQLGAGRPLWLPTPRPARLSCGAASPP
jgi:alpha-tubulin suppressor-like RCC1 family protein